MAMHKGMCGRSENTGGPATTLSEYLTAKYPEEMKRKLTFEEWWKTVCNRHWYEDQPFLDREHAARAGWEAGQENK